jgi:predicted dehydrogenase
MKSILNIGIIGCGSMGEIHARCISQIEGVKLAAVYDTDPQKARELASKFECVVLNSLEQLFVEPDIDAVYVCTPHNTHGEIVMAALEHGKHVFCEKPLALSTEEAVAVAVEAEKRGLIVAVGFNHRFTQPVGVARAFLREHNLTVVLAQLQFSCSPFMEGWAGDPVIGGGVLHCLGSHAFDLLNYLLQKPVNWVYCTTARRRLPVGFAPDTAIVTIGYEGGTIATCALHDHAPSVFSVGEKNMIRIELVTLQGTMLIWGIKGIVEWFSTQGTTVTYKARYPKETIEEMWGYLEENRRFIARVQGNDVELPTARDGVYACKLVKAAELSAQENRPITLGEVI